MLSGQSSLQRGQTYAALNSKYISWQHEQARGAIACAASCGALSTPARGRGRHSYAAGAVQDLHLVKAQCGASTLVTKVKLVERCFKGDHTVQFHMHESAPSAPPAPLPYFETSEGEVLTEEKDVARHLAKHGAGDLIRGANVQLDALPTVLDHSATVNKAVKTATKSKDAEMRSCTCFSCTHAALHFAAWVAAQLLCRRALEGTPCASGSHEARHDE